jgi:alpha-L-fucosidase
LLLGVGPDKTGALVPEVTERLRSIGAWMEVNGEGIYGTVPWKVAEAKDWQFTQHRLNGNHYAFFLPGQGADLPQQLGLPRFALDRKAKIYLLGYAPALSWSDDGKAIQLKIPGAARRKLAGQPAWAFRITP